MFSFDELNFNTSTLKNCLSVEKLDREFLQIVFKEFSLSGALLLMRNEGKQYVVLQKLFSENDFYAMELTELPEYFKKAVSLDLLLPTDITGQTEKDRDICIQVCNSPEIYILAKFPSTARIDTEIINKIRVYSVVYSANRQLLISRKKSEKFKKIAALKQQQIQTIFELSNELNLLLDREKIISVMLHTIMGQFLISRCAVFLQEKSRWELISNRGVSACCITGLRELTAKRKISDILDSMRGKQFINIRDIPSVENELKIVIPILSGNQIIGLLLIGDRADGKSITDEQLEFIGIISNLTSEALERCRTVKALIQQREIKRDLRLAYSIQKYLLPSVFPSIEGYEFIGDNSPSRDIGGDYFDVIPLSGNKIAFTIADVSGKGISASLLMSNLQASLHTLLLSIKPNSDRVTTLLNKIIYKNTQADRFISFFLGILDPDTGEIEYTNAGHNYPIVFRENGSLVQLESTDILLGVLPDIAYQRKKLLLNPGELLLLYTDGITEAENRNGVEYGEEHLMKLLKKNARKSGVQILKSIQRSVKRFTGQKGLQDDSTLLIIRRS